ncbi:hypothetical protein FHW69_003436 [Luteibacter sp. Sphag1AF]|uniref:hypothetical protein n=1 Tax=Luteibacter sp. Sphag1AF TaxID=2587031 RepID=UPI0016201704|nr:hypothetical protein [Luteibacter sp. Sphag1AF]MBB3228791.1 hypothetical protein [Luteibacter sp. Sphag1AF]
MQPIIPGVPRRRPWSLLVSGDLEPSGEVLEEITTIFELNPAIPGVELRGDGKWCTVVRDYPSGHTSGIDDALQVIFAEQPEIAEVHIYGSEARAAHVATHDAPFWHRDGKAIADINAQMQAGKISPAEAIDMLKALFESDRA